MRRLYQKRIIIFLVVIIPLFLLLTLFFNMTTASENLISIQKDLTQEPDFILDPDPNDVYNHIIFKIKPYKTFRLALNLHMDDGEDLWIYYAPTSAEPSQEYEGGPIYIGLDSALVDKKWHIIDLNINLDLENFVISELRSIKEIEILGNRYDLAFIITYRELGDGSRSNKIIDDFSLPGQNLTQRGWTSSNITYFSIGFDADLQGFLMADYTPQSTEEDPNDTEDTLPAGWYYYGPSNYYGGTGYYGGYYGSGYYGSGYYGSGYYGGGYYGSGYYGSGYYGGGYYGGGYGGLGGYYGGGYYGGGYGGLYGGYGGLYGGGYYGGLYGSLYGAGGLSGGLYGLGNYFGGPIGLGGFGGIPYGGMLGLFI